MKKRISVMAAVIALGLGGTTGAWAQEVKGDLELNRDRQDVDVQIKDRDTERVRTGAVTSEEAEMRRSKIDNMHKASGLIGMKVKNAQGEELGDIKDLAVDLKSGKISYAVLGVGGFLGIGEKFIAIPPGAFAYSDTREYLLLSADKSKLEGAPGFAKTNWPDPASPSWGAGTLYWQDDERRATDPSIDVETDLDRSSDLEVELDKRSDSRLDINTDADRSSAEFRARAGGHQTFQGRIQSVNVQQKTFTVRGEHGVKTFKLHNQASIKLDNQANARLSDLQQGNEVQIKFDKGHDGGLVAHSVTKGMTDR